MAATATIAYEWLGEEDVNTLSPALKQAGMTIAYPHISEPVVAKVDGEIVGFGFAQLMPHCEPLWVKPEWRGQGIAEELAKRVIEHIKATGAQRWLCIAQSPFAEKLCRDNGMVEVQGKIFVSEP